MLLARAVSLPFICLTPLSTTVGESYRAVSKGCAAWWCADTDPTGLCWGGRASEVMSTGGALPLGGLTAVTMQEARLGAEGSGPERGVAGLPLCSDMACAPLGWGVLVPKGQVWWVLFPLSGCFPHSPPRTPALELELSRPTWGLGCCGHRDGLSCLRSVVGLLRPSWDGSPFPSQPLPAPQPPPAQLCCGAVIQRMAWALSSLG